MMPELKNLTGTGSILRYSGMVLAPAVYKRMLLRDKKTYVFVLSLTVTFALEQQHSVRPMASICEQAPTMTKVTLLLIDVQV